MFSTGITKTDSRLLTHGAIAHLGSNSQRCPANCDDRAVFKFFLVDAGGEVQDPAGFVTAVPNWTVDETFLMAHGRRFRIVEIRTGLQPEMLDTGFNGVFVVEPA